MTAPEENKSAFAPVPVPANIVEVNGNKYMPDGRGDLKPLESIPARRQLEDELVRKEIGYALALHDQIARFKGHGYENLGNFDTLLMQEFEATKGGAKGNRTYTTVDGLYQIKVRIQDKLEFGPELAAAKALFDECLREWAEGSRQELRSLVTNAFDTEKEGEINRAHVFILLNTESDDPRWKQGQEAIRSAIRIIGKSSYLQYQFRKSAQDKWQSITIDLAKA